MDNVMWAVSTPVRIAGYALFAAGAAAGIIDLYHSMNLDRLVVTTLGDLWFVHGRGTAPLAEDLVRRYFGDPAWFGGVGTLLRLPGWLGLFLVGTLILIIAQIIYRET